jgi:glycosyltransferase involved in cell wall biosynthesis
MRMVDEPRMLDIERPSDSPQMSATFHRLIPQPQPQLLSVVVPLFNEQSVMAELRTRLTACVAQWPWRTEMILVNDGSNDRTLELLLSWADVDCRVRVIGLARNFGHQAALTAGLDEAAGDVIVAMDGDLQDPPELVPTMIAKYREGFHVVTARRRSRAGETIAKRLSAWIFYRAMRALVHRDLPCDAGDFRLVSRQFLDALKQMRETHRFMRGMVAWVGFSQTIVDFDRPERFAGRTHYSLRKMIQFAATAAVSFSPLPLRMILLLGTLIATFGLADGAYAVARQLLGYPNVRGWTSVMAAVCLIGGGMLISIGILGEYVGRIFEEIKGRPLYVISDTANVEGSSSMIGGSRSTGRPNGESIPANGNGAAHVELPATRKTFDRSDGNVAARITDT